MSSRNKVVVQPAREVDAGEELIAREQKALKKTKTQLGKQQETRAQGDEKAVEAMEDYKDEVQNAQAPLVAPR